MQNVVITGVSSGIGNVTARYLADKGIRVIGTVRKSIDAQKLIEDLGDRFIPLVLDVRDQKAIDQSILELTDILDGQGIAALVNNAGVAVNGPLQLLPIEDLQYQFDVNVIGLMRITQSFLPLLGAKNPVKEPLGRIINIGSISGLVTRPFVGPYSASKFALEALSDALRRELGEIYNMKVVLIQPGPVKTPIWEKARKDIPSYPPNDYEHILAKRSELIDVSENMAIDTIVIAKAIHQAITSSNPKARYLITKKKWLIRLMANVLPDYITDRLVSSKIRSLLKS